MEMAVLLVFAAAVAASAAIIYFIMAVGMKEKTYEEAIAEQRRKPDDHLLLSRSTKDKQKEKKVKKTGKKVKEKTEKVVKVPQQAKKAHVVFVQPEAVIANSAEDEKQKKKSTVKVKPILVNKNDLQLVQENPSEVNHFDKIHPKDDLELRRLSRDDSSDKKEIAAKLKAQQKQAAKAKKDKENIPPNNAQTKKPEVTPKKTEKQASLKPQAPAKVENQSAPAKVEKKPASAKVEKQKADKQVAPSKVEKHQAPAKVEKQQAPAKVEKQQAPSKVEKQQAPSKVEKQQAAAKVEKQQAAAKLEKQQAAAKVEKQQTRSKNDKHQAPAKVEKQQAPAKVEKQQAPAKVEKQQAPAKVEKQQTPAKVEKQQAPAKVEKQQATAKVEKQQAPAKVEKQQAPAKVEKQQAPAKVEKQPAPTKPEKQPAPTKAEKQTTTKQQPPKQEAPARVEKQVVAVRIEKQQNATSQKHHKANGLAKKKKAVRTNEMDVIQQMAGELERVNMNLIEPLLLKSDLSLSENQRLIELLLNKQMASGEKSEWIEGRQDPMVKLKKAFAEKERALDKANESLQALHLRLKEMGAERLEERTRNSQTVRALDEEKKIIKKKLEALEEAFKVDKVNMVNQIQQLQAKLTEDHVLIRKLKEDESKVADLVNKIQHLENLLKAEAQQHQNSRVMAESQLRQKEEEMQSLRMSLSQKIEEEKALHAQTEEKFKNFANSFQGRENLIKELTAAKDELERQIMASRQREAEALAEVAKLKDNILLEHDKFMSQAAEIQRLHEENQRLREQRSDVPQLQNQVLQLQDENGALMSRLMAATERPAAEGRENGDVAEEKHNAKLMSAQLIHEEALREKDLEMEKLHEKVKQTDKLAAEVKLANGTVEKLKSEMNAQKTEILRLTEEVEAQRKKNDELRTKNYKVMDALSASEKMVQTKMQEMQTVVHETKLAARLEEQKSCRQLLIRVFPDITVEETTVHEEWLKNFADAVSKYIEANKSSPPVVEDISASVAELEKQNSQLTAMVNHYKTIIDETEGMLNKLQSHIEQEESKWRQQLDAKEAELEEAKKERDQLLNGSNSEMQSQLKELQNKLIAEEAEKHQLQVNCQKALADLSSVEALQERLSADMSTLTAEKQLAEEALRVLEKQMEELRTELEMSKKESSLPSSPGSVQNMNGATNGPASSEVTVSEKASKPRKITGWIKKKVGKSPQQSPNLSAARHDDFISAEKAESS